MGLRRRRPTPRALTSSPSEVRVVLCEEGPRERLLVELGLVDELDYVVADGGGGVSSRIVAETTEAGAAVPPRPR